MIHLFMVLTYILSSLLFIQLTPESIIIFFAFPFSANIGNREVS